MTSTTAHASVQLLCKAAFISGLLAGTSVFAQAAPPSTTTPSATPAPAETIIVRASRPIQESDRAALQIQRTSPSLVSVLSADEAGRLADQNIAQALSRLPGIAVERDQGQARYINLRGQPRRWTNVSIDGMNVVSPEGRDTRFDNIPSAIASQITVNKAITPDMSGDTVSGNVNIRTRSAFDYKGFAVRGGLQLGYVELGEGAEMDASLVVSNRFFEDKLGILAQASYYYRDMVTNNWETDPYLRPGGTLQGATGPSGIDRRPGSETRRWAREFENKLYRLERGNVSGSLRADFRPTDLDKLFAQTVYTQFTDDELRNNYIFRFDANATNTATTACPTTVAPQTTSGANDICNGNTPTKGTVFGTRINANFRSGQTKEFMWTNTIGGDHERFGWNLAWRINYTETEDGRDASGTPAFQSPTDPTLRPTVEYDFTDVSNNIVKLYRTVVTGGVRSRGAQTRNIDDFPLDFVDIVSTKGGDYTSAWTGKFDGSRDFNAFGGELTAKFGGLYTTRSKKSREIQFRTTAANVAAAGRAPITYSSLAIDDPYEGTTPIGFDFRYYGLDRTKSLMKSLVDAGIAQRQDGSGAFYEVTEDILAAYGMGTLKLDWGSVVFGARVEQTKNTGAAFSSVGLIEVGKDDTQVYPSLHVNWDFHPDMKLRFGLTTGASRPDFDELAPNFSISDSNRTISGGNPQAGPEKAVGFDAYWEYFIQPQGYLMAGVFYKDISNALFQQSGTFGLTQFDEPTRPRSEYTFTTFRNGGDGYISGIEFGYNQFAEQLVERLGGPDWAEGFGIRLTATFSQSEINIPAIGTAPARKAGLPGASDTVYNASLVYEKYGLSARLAYQYRSNFLQSVGGYTTVNNVLVPDGNGDVFWNDTDQLDFSARFEVSKSIELTFDAVNLLDSPGRRFADSALYSIEYETFGARYLAGVRFKF